MLRTLSPISLGVLCALGAMAAFSTGDALVKALGTSLSTFEIGFFTTIFSFLPAVFTKPRAERWRDTFKLNRPALMLLVAVCRTVSAIMITYAFVTIPLAEAYCLVFLIPVLATILSVIVLKEQVSLDRWALVVISFLGVLLVVRPGFREIELGHVAAFVSAVSAAVSLTTIRLISGAERRVTLFVLPGLLTLTANIVGLLIIGFSWPSLTLIGGLIICGVLGGIGYMLQLKGVALAPASRVAPMQYSQIIWALLYGALFFSEVPDAISLAGLGVIVAAGLANIFADGARTRIAGRWAEYRARRDNPSPDDFKGPGPDPV
ncbi:DMT family transporter [Devosia sp. CN2-171]|jgi:drug/metabolite transporter (DMT)-like permease|uniref:DMT family transporter n=1 Tax=Devosia sp. CN2-171 TaxID=3400909 RepID=UPI003BF90689